MLMSFAIGLPVSFLWLFSWRFWINNFLHVYKIKAIDDLQQGNVHLLPKTPPELVRINIKSLQNDEDVRSLNVNYDLLIEIFEFQSADEQQVFPSSKQIPIISDISRIKKIVEILGKVGEIIGSLPEIQELSVDNRSVKRVPRNDTEHDDLAFIETTMSSTNVN